MLGFRSKTRTFPFQSKAAQSKATELQAQLDEVQKEVTALQKWAGDDLLSPEEQHLVVRAAARQGQLIDADKLRRAEEAKAQLPELRRNAELCELRMRETYANAEKEFALAMKGKIDDCFCVFLYGDDFQPAGPLPPCQLHDLVMVQPSPKEEPPGIELFLGDQGPKLGILESVRAAEVSRQIINEDRKWAGDVFSFVEFDPEHPKHLCLMLFRITPEYWDQLMAAST